MRSLLRCLVLCLVMTAAAVPAGARPRPTDQPVTAAGLKSKANQAAAKYAEAQATYARLGDQVAALQRQVDGLEGRIAPLRDRITRQAVAVYQGDVALAAVVQFEAAAAMMRSDRSAHLVAELSARDIPAIDVLLDTRQRLRDRQSALAARRHDQEITMAGLAAQRDEISAELTALAALTPPKPGRALLPRASRSQSPLTQRLRTDAPAFICPIDGPLAFSDDFGAPRGGGRRHMGNDLLNARGTPNVAVVNGTIATRPWAGGGITIFLTAADGTTYVYMHLMQIVGAVPRAVAQGEVIGLTGDTGDAQGYHTHFEVHPAGGPAVDPYPLVSAACR